MRQRTSYPKPFKAQVVQECLQPGVSMASVALRHGINANLVRKWIPAYRDRQAPALPAFIPMKLAPATRLDQQMPVSIEIPFGQQKLTVHWPSSDPEGCAVLSVSLPSDPHRRYPARHRADGHARRYRDCIGQSDRGIRCGEAALCLSVCQSPRQPDESFGARRCWDLAGSATTESRQDSLARHPSRVGS